MFSLIVALLEYTWFIFTKYLINDLNVAFLR